MQEARSPAEERLMLPQKEAAALLGWPESALKAERRRGRVPYKRIGTRYWYHRATLENIAATSDGETCEHPEAGAVREPIRLRRARELPRP